MKQKIIIVILFSFLLQLTVLNAQNTECISVSVDTLDKMVLDLNIAGAEQFIKKSSTNEVNESCRKKIQKYATLIDQINRLDIYDADDLKKSYHHYLQKENHFFRMECRPESAYSF